MLKMQLRCLSFQLMDCFARLSPGHDFFQSRSSLKLMRQSQVTIGRKARTQISSVSCPMR
jgi:hypothetical protein